MATAKLDELFVSGEESPDVDEEGEPEERLDSLSHVVCSLELKGTRPLRSWPLPECRFGKLPVSGLMLIVALRQGVSFTSLRTRFHNGFPDYRPFCFVEVLSFDGLRPHIVKANMIARPKKASKTEPSKEVRCMQIDEWSLIARVEIAQFSGISRERIEQAVIQAGKRIGLGAARCWQDGVFGTFDVLEFATTGGGWLQQGRKRRQRLTVL